MPKNDIERRQMLFRLAAEETAKNASYQIVRDLEDLHNRTYGEHVASGLTVIFQEVLEKEILVALGKATDAIEL